MKPSFLSKYGIYILTAIVCIAYVLFSTVSTGFYQHDEIGHYFNMLAFWKDPNVVLGNWGKAGYKVVYALPSLLGYNFLVWFNCAVSAVTCLMVYKIVKEMHYKYALFAFLLMASVPIWIQISFRNYADNFSGLILTLIIYFHVRKKYLASALILSYLTIIRQEFYILATIYGVYLAVNKRFVPFLSLGLFPILYDIWGYMATGDILYLINSTKNTADVFAGEYMRSGFDHFFVMSIACFGAVQVSYIVIYFLVELSRRFKAFDERKFALDYQYNNNEDKYNHVLIFLSFFSYFLLHCLFNFQAMKIGPSAVGHLRYMSPIAPAGILMAQFGLERSKYLTSKKILFIGFALFAILAIAFMTYKNNSFTFTEERDWFVAILVIAVFAIILLMTEPSKSYKALLCVSIISLIFTVKPIKSSPEDQLMKKVTQSLIAKKYTDTRKIYVNHVLFKFNYNKIKNSLYGKEAIIDSLTMESAEPGSIILWESHYGYRPKLNPHAVNTDYFSRRPNQYTVIQNQISSDNRFQVVVFEKTSK